MKIKSREVVCVVAWATVIRKYEMGKKLIFFWAFIRFKRAFKRELRTQKVKGQTTFCVCCSCH